MEEPIVSVIMTTYNWKKERISEAIKSIINQSYKNLELIIVDDCSTNNIWDYIKSLTLKHPNIKYSRNTSNLWVSKSSNKWIKESKWKYIARIDDDDIWNDKDKIKKQVEFMENNPPYGLCWAENIIIIDEKWNIINNTKHRILDNDIREHILEWNQFTHSSTLFRRESLEKVWLYNENYRAALDYEIVCKVWALYKFANIKWISVSYRINTNWITKKKYNLQYKNALKIFWNNRKNYPHFFRALGVRGANMLLPTYIKEWIKDKIKNTSLYNNIVR